MAISYSAVDAAAEVGLSERAFERVVAAGGVVVRWSGGKRLFRHDELDAWVDSLPLDKPK